MKNQALFSSKDESEKLKCCLLQFLFGAFRVKFSRTLKMKCCHIFFLQKICEELIQCKMFIHFVRKKVFT